ncbi:UDP-Glycosyltransferase/glycogen phosphorylase [Ophiobolus disseminans]|uniref:UDP-Glycosyltransferase/glycogen phosphorylase n=1 Tax=Ophiobolus disseminans TaxID=1469910 RepID=A0A6A6ZVD4_9PLEO|nr:UDP-Glycosyltransferase/glycogen phosphorylase [Ophiobolus disseminans]
MAQPSPSQEKHRVTPTGTLIHEPTFPNISGTPPDPANGPTLKLSATDGGSPASMSQQELASQTDQPRQEPEKAKAQAGAATSRPTQQRWATEMPKPSAKHSFLGDNKATQRNKSETIEFDPYSSSSSDSSDDERLPDKSLSHDNTLAREESRKRRGSNGGPFSKFKMANEHFRGQGRISKSDGRLKLSLLEKDGDSGYLAKALGAVLNKHTKNEEGISSTDYDKRDIEARKIAPEDDEMEHDSSRRVKLNIVIIIIGSRGDIQPFIRIGKILQNDYGHRVRMATHPAFKDFVEKDCGLEFFSIGGNPAELMAFMVKNPGLIPNLDTIKEGEIGRRRAQMYEMFGGMWRACINATDDETDKTNAKMMGDKAPFIADAIIANPPSFAPPHIAEKLGIPLHMMFTFPYTPTVHFPHPLANIKASNVEATYGNFMSYPLVEMMTWQGLGDLINRFRSKILYLEEVSTLWAPGQLYRLKVPYTYMWSPSLIPKPKDWGPEIEVTGFVFLDLASSFTPPDDLKKFLDNGDPPVYIGFGSIVVDDPDSFTKMIFEAVKSAGCRALVSKGWGGFGSNADCPDNIFMLENTPHDWLFPRCAAVVHHGGAGTTAIGLKTAKPTMIVPFFGDQPFWGAMVSKAKAGAHECIPYKKLNAERLAEGIKQCLTEEARENVKKIAKSIEDEGDGALNAVRSFHRSLPLRGEGSLRCDFLDNRAAAWKIKNTDVKLSALAAEVLVEKKRLKWSDLRLVRHYEWNDFGGPGEPITGVWGSLMTTLTDAATGVGGVPVEMGKSIKKRERIKEKKRAHQKRKQHQKETLSKVNSSTANGDGTNDTSSKEEKKGRPTASRGISSLSKIEEPEEELAEELAHDAGAGFRKTGGAIARFPMNFSLALTQGFHNAPRLYGDETVRRPPRVTGFHSGLRAGRDELIYGVKDGVTGIVTQPIRGAKQKGFVGAARGVGFGIGGFVLKDLAALVGPGAYFMKGLDAEYMKRYQPTNYLRRARIAQGQKELQTLETQAHVAAEAGEEKQLEKRDKIEQNIGLRWEALQTAIAEEKKKHKSGLMGSLLGLGEKKDGQRMPRKSKEHTDSRPQSRSKTIPVAKTEKQITKEKKSMDREGAKMRLDGSNRGLNRSSTAPITILEHSHTNAMKPLERPNVPDRPRSIKEEEENTMVGNVHLADGMKSPSGEHVNETPDSSASNRPDFLAVESNDDNRRPSADTGSESTRVEHETQDWAAVRKQAEAVEGGRPLELRAL